MTSPSNYYYVQSSSRLLENQEVDEDVISFNQEVPNSPQNVDFFQDDAITADKEIENNKVLHQKRYRALSISKEEKHKVQNDSDLFTTQNRRRHNSFNEVKLPDSLNNQRQVSNNGIDKVDIKSSFRKILNAGKQFQHSISVQSVKSNKNKPSVQNSIPFQYNRSQSYNQNPEYEDDDNDLFNEQGLQPQGGQYDAYLNANDSKLNFLSKSFEEKSNIHSHFKGVLNTPASVAEESLSASSSTSQSSTPSSSVSKNRLINDNEENVGLLDDTRNKLFMDENNNVKEVKEEHELVRMGDLKLVRNKKNDSIRMRHHSSKQTLYVPPNKTNLKMPKEFQAVGDSKSILVNNGLDSPTSSDDGQIEFLKGRNRRETSSFKNYFVITLMFVVNLINYIDRYTLAGVLTETQDYFSINDSESGLLQTVFIVGYMLFAPLFGYLGDRYPRKWLVIFGIAFWSCMTLAGSFVPQDMFWLFVAIRCFVGIGEASYSCVAPTIIGDLFTNEVRTRMLAIFYLAVPVGSGLGYILGSNITAAFDGDWRWSLRFTPMLGALCVILLIFFVKEPKRGGAEGSKVETNNSSIIEDAIYLCKNKTYVWVTIGFTFASFVLGGLSWWVPAYVQYAIYSKGQTPVQIPLYFGVVTCFSGLFGVAISSILSPKLRTITKKGDALICAIGSLIAVPTLYIIIIVTRSSNPILFWFLVSIAISAMCLSWTVIADILLYVIHPNKRSIASALNILIIHLFGDAFSPYVIGAISDSLRSGSADSYYTRFTSLQMALYTGPFFALMSFAAYLHATFFIEDDKKKVDLIVKKSQKSLSDPSIVDKTENASNNSTVDQINENVENNKNIQRPDRMKDSNENLDNTNQEIKF